MNIMSHKKTVLILILIIGLFFGYWFLFLSKKEAQQSNANKNVKAQTTSSGTQYDKDFVSSLIGLNSVKLDKSVLESKVYKALNYPEKPFVVEYPKESGRPNPFLPIGFEQATVVQAPAQQSISDKPAATTTPKVAPSASTTPQPTPKRF